MHYIYEIKLKGVVLYIGRTNDLDRRESEHRRDYTKNKKKVLYEYLNKMNVKQDDIILEPIDTAKTKVEAKRKEMFYMLLYTLFKGVTLYQRIPNIKDGF